MGTKLPRHVRELSDAVGKLMEYVAYELNREGLEGVILGPLGQYPSAAECCARWLCDCDETPYIRCVGALIPAYTPAIAARLPFELWNDEAARREKSKDEMIVLETNSVAERFVITAIRWLSRPQPYRDAGFELLEDMVRRANRGENWNDAHCALAAIVKHRHTRAGELVDSAATSSGPEFLIAWAKSFAAGERRFIDQGDALAEAAPTEGFELPKKYHKKLKALIASAEAFDKAEQGADWSQR